MVYEPGALFRVDEYGFFIYWNSEGRVSASLISVDIVKIIHCYRMTKLACK